MSSINWTLTKIVNNIDILQKHKNVLSYITNAVKNFCIDEYRKVAVRRRRETDFKSMVVTHTNGIAHSLEFILEDLTSNDTEKAILTRIAIDKQSVEEVSEQMNIPRREIDSLLMKVKAELS